MSTKGYINMNKQTNDIFSRRLRQARMMKGFSLEKLSQCVTPAITRQAINKVHPTFRVMRQSCRA